MSIHKHNKAKLRAKKLKLPKPKKEQGASYTLHLNLGGITMAEFERGWQQVADKIRGLDNKN